MCYFRNMELLWASPRRRHTQAICCLRNVIFWYQLPARSRSTNRMQTKFRLKYVKIPMVLCLYFYSNNVLIVLFAFYISLFYWDFFTECKLACQDTEPFVPATIFIFSKLFMGFPCLLNLWSNKNVLQWKQLQNTSLRS